MFLVHDTNEAVKERILGFLNKNDCAIAVLLSAAHFEWTVSRAILALGVTPTARLRRQVGSCHGLDKYKDLWAAEVLPGRDVGRLPIVVREWSIFREHFKLRHLLIHGRESCSLSHAEPRVNSILAASADVNQACASQGVNLHSRLKTRRKPRQTHG